MNNKQQKLIETFGVTRFANKAGFILADGTMLDLSNANHAHRIYHAEALNVLYGRPSNKQKEWVDLDLVSLMSELSLIRFCYSGLIHVAHKPTPQQFRQLYKMIAYRSNPFEVLISHPSGVSMRRRHIVSPTMKALQEVFSDYDQSPMPICEDEFLIVKNGLQLNLLFRPLQKIIGSYQRTTRNFSLDPHYSCALPLFKEMTADFHCNRL